MSGRRWTHVPFATRYRVAPDATGSPAARKKYNMTNDPKEDTRKRIKAAVLALESENKKVTQRSVADRARVSFSSLTGILNEVKEEIRAERQEMEMVPEAPARVMGAFNQAWQEAYRAAAATFDTEREASASALAEAKEEGAEMFETLCEMEEARDDAVAEGNALQAELDALRRELDDERSRRVAKEAMLAEASARLSERDGMLERQLAEAKDATAAQAAIIRDQDKRLAAIEAELAKEQDKAAEAQKALEAKAAELRNTQTKLAEQASDIKEFDKKRLDAQAQAKAAMAERDGLSSELKSVRDDLEVKEKLLIEAKARLAERDDLLARISPTQNTQTRRSKKKDAKDAEPCNQDVDTLPLPFTGAEVAEGGRPAA